MIFVFNFNFFFEFYINLLQLEFISILFIKNILNKIDSVNDFYDY